MFVRAGSVLDRCCGATPGPMHVLTHRGGGTVSSARRYWSVWDLGVDPCAPICAAARFSRCILMHPGNEAPVHVCILCFCALTAKAASLEITILYTSALHVHFSVIRNTDLIKVMEAPRTRESLNTNRQQSLQLNLIPRALCPQNRYRHPVSAHGAKHPLTFKFRVQCGLEFHMAVKF